MSSILLQIFFFTCIKAFIISWHHWIIMESYKKIMKVKMIEHVSWTILEPNFKVSSIDICI